MAAGHAQRVTDAHLQPVEPPDLAHGARHASHRVGGVPMTPYPPADAVARVSRAMRQVGRLDGL